MVVFIHGKLFDEKTLEICGHSRYIFIHFNIEYLRLNEKDFKGLSYGTES